MKQGTLVKNIKTNQYGVVVSDLWGCCSTNEIPIVYEGEDSFLGTDFGDLEVLGDENAVPSSKRCGLGLGEKCCIFLTLGSNGFECSRFTELRYCIIMNSDSMNAKRHPKEMYPKCMLDIE